MKGGRTGGNSANSAGPRCCFADQLHRDKSQAAQKPIRQRRLQGLAAGAGHTVEGWKSERRWTVLIPFT